MYAEGDLEIQALYNEASREFPIIEKRVGIERLVTEQYANPTHFIYELLQNASDADATEVKFTLETDRLIFQHNGTKIFRIEDVVSICNIGKSTKENDNGSIGKFGIGFKSVYRYTSRPEVYSGKYRFAIEQIMVPTPLRTNSIFRQAFKGETAFLLPLNSRGGNPEKYLKEIEQGLMNIGSENLIFLKRIETIDIQILEENKYLRREFQNNEIFKLFEQSGLASRWMKWSGFATLSMPDTSNVNDIDKRRVPISVAFKLDGNSDTIEFLPSERGMTAVTFDLSEFNSGLNFHVNGPFVCGLSRETLVHDSLANLELFHELARLVSDETKSHWSISGVPQSFINILPSQSSHKELTIFAENAIELFRNNSLVQSIDKKLFKSGDLVLLDAKLFNLFDHENWKTILQNSTRYSEYSEAIFVPSPEFSNYSFLKKIIDANISANELADILLEFATTNSAEWVSFFQNLSVSEIINFYEFASSAGRSFQIALKNIPCVLVAENGRTKAKIPGKVFLPSNGANQGPNVIAEDLWSKIQEQDAESILDLFSQIGLRKFDAQSQAELDMEVFLLGKVEGDLVSAEDLDIAKKLLPQFLEFAPKSEFLEECFRTHPILISVNAEGSKVWSVTGNCYIDSPYRETGWRQLLSASSDMSRSTILWDGYDLSASQTDILAMFGALVEFEISDANLYLNPEFSYSHLNSRSRAASYLKDFTISDLDAVLAYGNENLKTNLLRFLSKNLDKYAQARYQQGNTYRRYSSQLVQALKSQNWIPGKDGHSYAPRAISLDNLACELDGQEINSLQRLLDLGLEERVKNERRESDDQKWAELGIPPILGSAIKELTQRLSSYSSEEQAVLVQDVIDSFSLLLQPIYFDEGGIRSQEASERAALSAKSDPKIVIVEQIQSVRKDYAQYQARRKEYLRMHYENVNGQVRCQLCKISPMPFRTGRPKRDFFYAPVFFDSYGFESVANSVALCPTCYAKWKFGSEKDFQTSLLNGVLGVEYNLQSEEINTHFNVSVSLAEEKHAISFSPVHFGDIWHIARQLNVLNAASLDSIQSDFSEVLDNESDSLD